MTSTLASLPLSSTGIRQKFFSRKQQDAGICSPRRFSFPFFVPDGLVHNVNLTNAKFFAILVVFLAGVAACICSRAGVSGSATLLDNIGTCAGFLRKFLVDHFQLSHDISGFACCRLRRSRSLFLALIARPSRGERFAFSRCAICVAIGTLGQQTDRFVPVTSRPCFGPTVPRN